MVNQVPKSRKCEDYSVEQLQRIQLTLFMLRDPELDNIYHHSKDNRRIQSDVAAMSKQWEELNAEAAKDPELARMHRDGHCHEAVLAEASSKYRNNEYSKVVPSAEARSRRFNSRSSINHVVLPSIARTKSCTSPKT